MLSNLFREAIIITNMTRALRQKERTKLYHLKKKRCKTPQQKNQQINSIDR